MEWYIAAILIIVILLVLIIFKVPIFVALAVTSLLFLWLDTGDIGTWAASSRVLYGTVTEFSLIALPLFIIMGELIGQTTFASDMFGVVSKWTTWLPGALAIASIWVSVVFGAVIGTAAGVAAVVGGIAVPVMLKHKYDDRLATGTIAGVSGLGVLIPPSVSFIMYGVVTGNSIGKLFIAGIVPGIMMAVLYSIFVFTQVKMKPEWAPKPPPSTWAERMKSLGNGNMWLTFLIIAVTIGTIWGGVLTPSEAGAGGSLVIIIIGLIFRQLGWAKIKLALSKAARATVRIMLIVISAKIFGYTLAVLNVPTSLVASVQSANLPGWFFFLAVMVLLFILGMFIDITPIILLTMPVVYPAMMALGYDPIWFGVVVVVNMCMAVITPPLGLSVFMLASATGIPASRIFRAALPFCVVDLIGIAILYFVPAIATWLPGTMIGR